MKTLYTIIFLGLSTLLVGQYDNLLIGTKAGVAFGETDRGDGTFYSIDIQKHISKGIYGILSYKSGQLVEGQEHSAEFGPGIFQADVMTQYSAVGLGLRKELKVSPKGKVGLSFSGLYVSQSRLDWDLVFSPFGGVNLQESQELYSERNDFGYGLSIEYVHRLSRIVRLGAFVGYDSQPSLINGGLRILAALGSENKEERPSAQPLKNWVEVRFGSLGGDGISAVPSYTLELGRRFSQRLSVYTKYGIAKGFGDRDLNDMLASYDEEEQLRYQTEFLAEDNESGSVIFHPIQSTTLGGGAKVALNVEGPSTLSFSGGVLWYRADVVSLSSGGSSLDFYEENFTRIRSIAPELGLHYDYNVSDFFYVGGKFEYGFGRTNIGVGVHAGMRF